MSISMETKVQLGSESSSFGRPVPFVEERNRNPKDRNKLNPLYRLTVGIIPLYKSCNVNFKPQTSRPQRLLTNPSEGVSNNGLDNVDANLICRVGDKLINTSGKVLVVLDGLGTGTFGQVFRCQREDTKEIVAVKVIKNKPAYHSQGQLEIKIATLLNNTYDPNNERHIVRLLDHFEHKQHICLVFELLSMSLLDVLTQNQFRGLPLSVVQRFTKQVLMALVALQDANVIHCDLKPENILIQPASSSSSSSINSSSNGNAKPRSDSVASSYNDDSPMEGSTPGTTFVKKSSLSDVKVIDFGSACFEGKTVYSYIQSRFYRSPEVLLGIPYNGAIDMWSLACVCAEMYLGLPLFPGVSQHNQISRIVEMLGVPPDFLIEGKNGSKYFTTTGSGGSAGSPGRFSGTAGGAGGYLHQHQRSSGSHKDDKNVLNYVSGRYRIKTSEEYAIENNAEIPVLKKYLRYTHLDEVIMKCPLSNKAKMSQEQKHNEMMKRRSFLDFLQGLFNLNPFDRWTAQQAMSHPFILNMPFNGTPFQPPVDLKAKERKLMYMYQIKQDAVRPEDAGSLGGLRAPTNFGSSHDQFTLLQYAHRRQSEPVDPNKISYYQPGQQQMQPMQQRLGSQPPLQQQQKTGIAAAVQEEESSMPEMRPSLKRGNPVHINASYVEESPMERMMQSQQQQQHQPGQKVSPKGARGGPPLPPAAAAPAYHMSQSYAPPSQYAQQQQQQHLQLPYSHFAHQQQAYFHINNNQPFSGGVGGGNVSNLPFPPVHGGAYPPQPGFAQPPSALSVAVSANALSAAASYSASSMGVFGQGGSMQDGPGGMVMTDFGLALLRPDMDEQRRLMSQNAGYTSHLAQSFVGSGGMPQHQHHSMPPRYGSHEKASPRSQQQQHQQQQYSTAHSLDYSVGNVSRYAMMNASAGGAPYGHQQQQPLQIDSSMLGGGKLVPELPSPVQQFTRGNTRRLQQHTTNTFAPSSSLSISIPTPLNAEPVPEPVLAYSFQNTDTSNSMIGSINYSNQWENTHIGGAAASLSRSLGLNTIQQQQQLQQNSRKNSDAPQRSSQDEYDELTDDSSPKVSYKSISTRGSESSTERDRSGSGGMAQLPMGVGPMLEESGSGKSGGLNRSNSGGSNGSGKAGIAAAAAVKGASDALENWDPFFDAEED